MKNLIKLFTVFVTAGFFLTSCEGPAGPAGKDGVDGVAGANGTDANETCKECHAPTVVDAVAVQFELSKHSYGEAAFEEAGNTACAPCHESEGFKYVVKNSTPTAFIADPDPLNAGKFLNPYVSSSSTAYGAIGCFTCHSSLHTTYAGTDFSPLTSVAEVSMTMWGGAKTINLTQKGGSSNLCIKCHQPRPLTKASDKSVIDYAALVSNPTTVFYDAAQSSSLNILKPSYRTGIHYGSVGAIFAGQGGVEFGTGYSNSQHTTVAACQDCHMAPMTGAAGGHTFKSVGNFNGCNVAGCHATPITSATTSKYWKQTRDDIKAKLAALAAKLTVGGIELLSRNPDSEGNLWYGLTANNYDGYINIYDPASNPGGVDNNPGGVFQNPNPGNSWSQSQRDFNLTLPKITLTNAQMGAIINFQLCLREYSLGIHNTAYTTTLLTNSIAALP